MLVPIPMPEDDCFVRQSTACTRQRQHSFYRFKNLIRGIQNSFRRAKAQPDIENQLPREDGNSCKCSSVCMRCEVLIGLVLVAVGTMNLWFWMHQTPDRDLRNPTEPVSTSTNSLIRSTIRDFLNPEEGKRRQPDETSLGLLGGLSTLATAAGVYYWISTSPEKTLNRESDFEVLDGIDRLSH